MNRYMGLLLAPVQLSADWSFSCIPPVETLADPRNLATAALYLWLIWALLAARPWLARPSSVLPSINCTIGLPR